jgi:hypothetical protein
VVSYSKWEQPLDGSFSWVGEFSAANFTEIYPWTMLGLQVSLAPA